jgi:ComF family protein
MPDATQLVTRSVDRWTSSATRRWSSMTEKFFADTNLWLERLLDALSPASCAACAGPRAGKPPFCVTCGEPAPLAPCSLAGVPLVVGGAYQAPLEPAILRFKFGGHSELARDLGRLLAARLRPFGLKNVDFVPVPLHHARLVERGYNQSALLSRWLARSLGGRSFPRALERVRSTEQQARLGRAARMDNVSDAFRAAPSGVPPRVVLVDDVVTTGATARACLKVLLRAGSEVILVAALARAG